MPGMQQADLPVIEKEKMETAYALWMASAGTVAWVMYQKFCNSPAFTAARKRLETVWHPSQGQPWQTGSSLIQMHSSVRCTNTFIGNAGAGINGNETPLQVLHELGRRAQTKLTCGFSAGGGKMAVYRSSSYKYWKPVPETTRLNLCGIQSS